MKINNVKINAYGNINNKEIKLEHGINIIQGKNESGKSTLLNYIISSFYGISKNKDGKELSDYDKYMPWYSSEFSGRIEYELDNGSKFEVFRDFNKKNPKIYNDRLEDITDKFDIDKKEGSKFFYEQTGVDKHTYLSTVVSVQEEVRLNDKDQSILIQKIANLAGTGEDNVSYKKAMGKLQDKIRDEIGTSKTSQKPINILEKEIKGIEDKIKSIIPYRNRKYEIDNEKEKIEEKIKELEIKKKILTELQDLVKSNDIHNKEIEIKEKNKNENLSKIEELESKESEINKNREKIEKNIKITKEEIEKNKNEKEDIEFQLLNISNQQVNENIHKSKNRSGIYLTIFIFLIIAGTILTVMTKNYKIIGIIGALLLINACVYVNNTKRKSRHKIQKDKEIEKNKIRINELSDDKDKIVAAIREKEELLREYEEKEKEINDQASMVKGQIILLDRNNEQIDKDINDIYARTKDKYCNKTEEIMNKYKDQFSGIKELINERDYRTDKVEEEINTYRIKIKGLDIEYDTILHQLDELVILEEKLEANNEKLCELKRQEEIINIAMDTLTEAYEEMKNTITPKFTQSLSSSIKKISDSKYEKVTINDDNGMIIENNRGEYIEASQLSTGTIDQLYLALRLSMIEDLSKEKLPIILDESFAYFDNNRLENILRYFSEELENHQTIIFTCTNREKELLDDMKVKYNLVEL